ncbi:hypothetical protein Cus16_1444 [Curtobacterium sp. ER1/6]|nr:hypothetical protein Cus16_1444 [Curtobacterium sp. ER1/6]
MDRDVLRERRKGRPRPSLPGGAAGVLLDGSLELRAGADLDRVARGDLDGVTRLRVATGARGAVGLLEGDPARDGDLGAVGDRRRDDAEQRVDDAVDGGLALAGLLRDGSDELGAVQ